MVTLQDVYDAFLSRVTDEDWSGVDVTPEDIEWMVRDWRSYLNQAIPYFKFPRCSLIIDEASQSFKDPKMSSEEVAILSIYMKQQWVKRSIDTWENIRPEYSEKDFSQANLLNSFIKMKNQVAEEAKEAERIYYRSRQKRPFDYSKLGGGGTRRGRR